MNSRTKSALIFIGGVFVGAVVTYFSLKDKFAAEAQEEIDSVKEAFSVSAKEEKSEEEIATESETKETKVTKEKPNITQFVDYGKMSKNYETTSEAEVPLKTFMADVIHPDEFGFDDSFDQVTYTYYADGVLTDEHDHVIPQSEYEDSIGYDWKDAFGEFEDDAVFLRNDALKMEYEILYDPRKFAEL